jgi:restriction endonuclease S subunit
MSSKKKTLVSKGQARPALVPRLRFPEFRDTGEWETNPLSMYAASLDAGVSVLSGDRRASNGEIGVLKTSCVTEGHFEPTENKVVVDHEQIARLKEPVRAETIIISRMNTVALVGANAYVDRNISNLFLPDRLWSLKCNRSASTRFLAYILGSDRGRAALSAAARGTSGSMKNISMPDVLGLKITAPSPVEQQKIADCLSSLDALITAQARKVEALKAHKKGLMQQLFPRDGEKQPRWRFPEFRDAGEWSEVKLINLSSEPLSNGVFNDPKKVGSGYKLVNVSDMYIETTIDESCLTLLELSPSDFEANQVIAGDIFFTRSSLVKSGIAVSNIYIGSSNDVTYDGHLIRFRPNKNKVVPLFAHYLFKTEPIRSQLIARGKTTTMTTIGQADVASVTLFYPEKTEQHRIATCLSSLDALIAAETQKHAALERHKRGLMQQLFPSPEK